MFKYPPPQPTPKEYELTVKANLDAQAFGLADYQSEHREILAGSDGEYEIDITVRFTAVGANFLTLVECKHYKRPVEREKVQALLAKLNAVGAHKGIMFSTSGFQSGAIEFAEAHGIALVEFVDGRSSYIRKSADFDNGPIPWSQMPPQIPRLVGWLHRGTRRTVVTPDYPEGLGAFLKG